MTKPTAALPDDPDQLKAMLLAERARRSPPRGPDSGHHEVASDGGAEHWATIASLIETCKLTGVDPQAYLTDVITRIVNGHPQNRIDELLPPHTTALGRGG